MQLIRSALEVVRLDLEAFCLISYGEGITYKGTCGD